MVTDFFSKFKLNIFSKNWNLFFELFYYSNKINWPKIKLLKKIFSDTFNLKSLHMLFIWDEVEAIANGNLMVLINLKPIKNISNN
jgi:hypothetical protein